MTLRQFVAAIALTCLVGTSAFASSPTCAPGELISPPCQAALAQTQEVRDQTGTPEAPSHDIFSAITEGVLNEMLAIW
jgi:hypothetical protein